MDIQTEPEVLTYFEGTQIVRERILSELQKITGQEWFVVCIHTWGGFAFEIKHSASRYCIKTDELSLYLCNVQKFPMAVANDIIEGIKPLIEKKLWTFKPN